MSKYKSSTSTSTTQSSNQPIWCSLSTPSQIARKYASIAPIWCHISRPRQLKKKFASTFNQAQNLLTNRQHSKERKSSDRLYSDSRTNANSDASEKNSIERETAANTYKNSWTSDYTQHTYGNSSKQTSKPSVSSSELSGRLLSNNHHHNHHYNYNNYDTSTSANSTNNYDNYGLLSSERQSLRKRDSSLDVKRKSDTLSTSSAVNPIVPSSTSAYLFSTINSPTSMLSSSTLSTNNASSTTTTNTSSNLNTTSSSSTGSRWPSSSSTHNQSTYKSSYDTKPNLSNLYDENLVPVSSATTVANVDTSRRPLKYNSSKYSYLPAGSGSKTEKIISKSSKSSPNLLSKEHDYEKYYTERYYDHRQSPTNKTNKSTGTTSTTNPYLSSYLYHHSTTNPYSSSSSSSNYNNNNSSSYYPSHLNHHHNQYDTSSNNYNSNREEKWNELESMLGAQSALLSRLESDFVANRSKLKANQNLSGLSSSIEASLNSATSLNATSNNSNIGTKGLGSTQTYSSTASKYLNPITGTSSLSANTQSKNTSNDLSSYDHLTGSSVSSSYVPGRYKTPTTSKKYKYNTKYDEIFDAESLVQNSNGTSGASKSLHQSKDNLLATSTNNLNSIGSSNLTTSKKSTLISSKTEPIIDLIKTLELNGEIEVSSEQKLKQKCSSEETNELLNMASAAIASKPRMTTNLNEKSDDIANTNDFVDEFINDYLTNTLNSSQSDYNRTNHNGHSQLVNENETSVNKSKSSSGSVKEKTKMNTIYNELTASELNEIEKCLNENTTNNNNSYYVNADNNTNSKLINETSSNTNNNWLVYLL